MRSAKMSPAITTLIILVFAWWFHEIIAVPYKMRSEYEVNDYDSYYDENGSQQDVYESNISSLDNSHENFKNISQKQFKQQIYKKEDTNKNDRVQINYNYNQNKYGIPNPIEIDKQSKLFDDGYGESIQGNINLQMKSESIEDKKPKNNDNPITDPVIHSDKSSFFLENEKAQYHNSEDVSKSENQEHTKKCTNQPLQKNEHYSQNFRQKNSSIELADNFQITGDPILKITSSVHDSEDITICWIETTTVKEDKKTKPAKRQVFREFTISFENSAPIPDKYLDCPRMEGEILSGKINVLKNTSFHEIIEKDTKMSKVVNLTTQSHDGNLFITEYKLIRCSTGTSVTKDVSKWVDKAEHKKKKVLIKVGPVKKILKSKNHNDVKNLNTAEYSHIEQRDVTNCTGNVHCDEKKPIAMSPCTGVDCEQKRSSLEVLTEMISTKSHTIDVSATEIHSSLPNISTLVRENNGLTTKIEEKFSTSTLSTLNLKTVILGPSCVEENCNLITTKSPVQDSKSSKKCSISSDCYSSSEVIGQQKYDNNNLSSVSTSRNCDDSFEVCNSSEFSDNSIEIPSSNNGQRLIYPEIGVLNNSSKNKNHNSLEEKITILPILPSQNSAKVLPTNLKEKSNVPVLSSTDVITKDIDSSTQFVKKGNESKLSIYNIETKPDHKQPTKHVTTKDIADIETNKTLPLAKKKIICSDINNCQKLSDFNNEMLNNYSMKIIRAGEVTSTKSKPNNILVNTDDETEFHNSSSECNLTDSQSDEGNCMKNIRFNGNLSDFSKLNYDHDSNDSTIDFTAGINSETIPYKDSKNKVPMLDVKSMRYRKPGKPQLALKIKLLLEQINENKEKKPLVKLEKKLTLKDNLNDDENQNLISRIHALNKSTDDLQSIKDLLNCTVFGNLTNISFDINDDIRNGIGNPKLQNSFGDIIHNHTEERIEKYQRKKRNIAAYVASKKKESMQIENIKKCLPEIRNDLKTGLNKILSKISTNLNTSRQIAFDKDTQDLIKPWKTGAIVSKNKNEKVIPRDKRSTEDLNKVLKWSKERIHKSADGSQLRSVTELTAFGDFEELPEDA